MKSEILIGSVDQNNSSADDVFFRIDGVIEIDTDLCRLVFQMDDQRLIGTIGRRKIFDRDILFNDVEGIKSQIQGIGSAAFKFNGSFVEITVSIGGIFLWQGIE